MFDALRLIAGAAFFFGVIGYALWKGGRPERVVALATLTATLATPLVFRHARLENPQWSVAAVDLVLLAVMGAVALKGRRPWLVLGTAIHALGAASHVALVLDPGIKGLAYLSSIVVWSYLTHACLLASAVHEHRRQRLYKRFRGSI